METINSTVSRVRNTIKAVNTDSFITDRYLYSIILKYGKAYIKRQDTIKKLLRLSSLFRPIPCMELVEINKIEACCGGIQSDCLFKRTKEKIPHIIEAEFGPTFRTISSIDGSIEIYPTTPSTYTSMTKTTSFKYNNNQYYWYLNDYLYFPDLQWDQVRVEAIFEGDITVFNCNEEDRCILRQDQPSPIPDFLFAEVEKQVFQDLGFMIQAPEDAGAANKQSQLR